jgi:hypothetical protein
MSCKKENCCKQERPRAEFTAVPDWVVNQLLTVAQFGFKNLIPWPSESVRLLAEKIAALVAENTLLRKLLDNTTPDTPISGAQFTITFGPEDQYKLHVPLTDIRTRHKLAKSLFAAAAALLEPVPGQQAGAGQLDLPFTE